MSAQPFALASLSDPAHYGLGDLGIQPAGGKIVQKKQRDGPLDRNVIHAVIDQVSSHGVVGTELKGDFELGAYSIGARNQNRVGILGRVQLKEPAKPADFTQHLFIEGLLRKILDALLGAVPARYINTRRGVG